MDKNIYSKIQVKPKFRNLFHYMMHALVHYIMVYGLYKKNKIKAGDFVKYNWKAYFHIRKVYDEKPGIYKVIEVKNFDKNTQKCKYKIDDGSLDECDTFWLRKVYWFEKKQLKQFIGDESIPDLLDIHSSEINTSNFFFTKDNIEEMEYYYEGRKIALAAIRRLGTHKFNYFLYSYEDQKAAFEDILDIGSELCKQQKGALQVEEMIEVIEKVILSK